MADLLDTDNINTPAAAPDQPTVSRAELQQMISAAVRASRDADSSSEADEDKVSETAASSAATATLSELLDQQQGEKSDLVSEAMAHTVKTRLEKKKDRYKPVPGNMVPFLKETSKNPEMFHGIPKWAEANDPRYANFYCDVHVNIYPACIIMLCANICCTTCVGNVKILLNAFTFGLLIAVYVIFSRLL